MMITRIVAFIVLFGYVCCTYATFWKQVRSSTKRDCRWTSWARTGLCFQMSGPTLTKFQYGRRLIRYKIEERNGGKACSGPSAKFERCSDDAVVAATFLKTITSAIPSVSGGNSGGGHIQPNGQSPDSTGHLFPSNGQFIPIAPLLSFQSIALPNVLLPNIQVHEPSDVQFQEPRILHPAYESVDRFNCVADFVGSNGKVRMAGRTCGQRRRKREVIQEEEIASSYQVSNETLSTKNRDVLFVIDESGSVGPKNFKKFLRLAKAVANSFCKAIRISKTQTRVGVLTFDKLRHPQIDFDDFFSRSTLIHEIGNIKYKSKSHGSTCLVEALQYSRKDMISRSRGSRVNIPGTERMVILMTDGCANCKRKSDDNMKDRLKKIGKQFTKQGISIFTFLVQTNASSCFEIMKGLVEGRQCYEQFSVETWAGVDAISQDIETSPCIDSWIFGRVTC